MTDISQSTLVHGLYQLFTKQNREPRRPLNPYTRTDCIKDLISQMKRGYHLSIRTPARTVSANRESKLENALILSIRTPARTVSLLRVVKAEPVNLSIRTPARTVSAKPHKSVHIQLCISYNPCFGTVAKGFCQISLTAQNLY